MPLRVDLVTDARKYANMISRKCCQSDITLFIVQNRIREHVDTSGDSTQINIGDPDRDFEKRLKE